MNCGLGNLDGLKRHLLPSGTMAGETRFDEVIADIGLGVAEDMENFCNHRFVRMADCQETFQADRASFTLSRWPFESITAVELKLKDADGFTFQDLSLIQSTSPAAGMVYLPEPPDAGPYWGQVRFTYVGGYWFETLEPEEEGYPSAAPATAIPLPKGLRLAWLNQCRAVWNAIDKLGTGLVDKPGVQTVIADLDFSPAVKRTLGNYVTQQPI